MKRTSYSPELKAEVVQEVLEPIQNTRCLIKQSQGLEWHTDG